MDTLKIVSTDPHTQGPFVVINKSDFNPDVHELYGDQDLGAPTERVPTMAELQAAHDQLLERERSLDAEKERIAAQEHRLADQAQANEVEAQRLRNEAVSLQAAKDAAAAATLATSTEKPAKAAKA